MVAGGDHEQHLGMHPGRASEGQPFIALAAGQRQVHHAHAPTRGVLDQCRHARDVAAWIAVRNQLGDRRFLEHEAGGKRAVVFREKWIQ
jgi:hypothetical protein